MRSGRCAWLLCSAVACADEVAGDVALEQRCEDAGPVRLLELAADDEVFTVRQFDDERLRVSYEDAESRDRTVLVPRCGGEAQPVAPNMPWVFLEGETLLGCDEDYALVMPTDIGDTEPTVLAQRGCAFRRSPHGLVTIDAAPDAEVGRLVLVRLPGGGEVIVETLLDDLLLAYDGPYFPGGTETHAYGRTSDASAWEIDLATGTRSLLVERALDFTLSPKYVLYRPLDDTDDGESAVVLRDRVSGDERVVIDAYSERVTLGVTDELVVLGEYASPWSAQWFWTNDLRSIEFPDGLSILRRLGDGRFFVAHSEQYGNKVTFATWRRYQWAQALWSCYHCWAHFDEGLGGLVVEQGPFDPYELLFVDEATGNSQQLAPEATGGYRILPDRRVLTLLDHTDPGPLVLHDYRDGSARTVAQHVAPASMFLTTTFGSADGRDVVWVDEDPDNVRALYYARLAAVD